MHHGDQGGVRTQGAQHIVRIDDAAGSHEKVSHLATLALDLGAGAEHGRMLDRGRDHMLTLTRPDSAEHG